MQTPLENFIDYKAQTGMQCGNYSIDVPPLQEGEQYRFHFDATKCIGCRCCEVACNEQNNNPATIKWRRVGEMEGGEFPAVMQLFNSMSCNHCDEPACLIGCPTESYIKFDNGIVFHDDEACIGCQYCTWNCPYGVPTYHEERHIVTKCHMCHERLAKSESPACVQACPSGAIEIETVNVKEWKEQKMDKEGNMPFLPDAQITQSMTRYTLPENIPDNMFERDEHHLKPAHSELPLVFMTVLTQISLGAFFALFLGELFATFGFEAPTLVMAILAFIPAAVGLPLSALHLGRPFKAMMAMKNVKSSWLSREAVALGAFVGLMTLYVGLYLIEVSHFIKTVVAFIILVVGILGIYSQAMIYRIKARPAWDRRVTNMKFFGVAYIGLFLVAFVALVELHVDVATPLIALGMLLALAQGFFSYEDYRELTSSKVYEMQKSARLYKEHFFGVVRFRALSFMVGALLLPLLVLVLASSGVMLAAEVTLFIALLIMSASELSDRFLFYTTVVPLAMAGSFFVGKQRD